MSILSQETFEELTELITVTQTAYSYAKEQSENRDLDDEGRLRYKEDVQTLWAIHSNLERAKHAANLAKELFADEYGQGNDPDHWISQFHLPHHPHIIKPHPNKRASIGGLSALVLLEEQLSEQEEDARKT